MDWMTVKEAGELWGITTRRAQILCANGKVKNARKLGNIWVMPKETSRPIDGRTREAKQGKIRKPQYCEGDGHTYEET